MSLANNIVEKLKLWDEIEWSVTIREFNIRTFYHISDILPKIECNPVTDLLINSFTMINKKKLKQLTIKT